MADDGREGEADERVRRFRFPRGDRPRIDQSFVPDGDYICRIVQMFDPNVADSAEDESPDFVIVLGESSAVVPVWSDILWLPDAELGDADGTGA